jgi:Tetratricopeptide repeat
MPSTRGRDPAAEEEFLGELYKGGELLAAGKIVEAREHLEKAHGLAPKNEKAQNLLGLTYFKLGLFDRASEVYEKLVNENPADATLRVNLGLVYLKTNNLERCIKEFETATDLEPTHKKAHNYLGLALAQQGTYAKAQEHFVLAGSDQMAEKMARAIANQSSPSGIQSAPSAIAAPPPSAPPPKTVVLGEEPPPPPPPDEEPIEVMSDEAPLEAELVAEPPPPSAPSAGLTSDWGAGLPSAPRRTPPPAPAEEMPMLEAAVEVVADNAPMEVIPSDTPMEILSADAVTEAPPPLPQPSVPNPEWLTTGEAAPAPAPAEPTAWVTETVADVPLEQPPSATDPRWDAPAPMSAETQAWAGQTAEPPAQEWVQQVEPSPSDAAPAADDASWATGEAQAPAATPDDASWATQQPAATPDDSSWATGEAQAPVAAADDSSWATGETAPATADASWSTGDASVTNAAPEDGSWGSGEAQAPAATPDDASWATGDTTAPVETVASTAEHAAWTAAPAPAEATAPAADDASWATGGGVGSAESVPTTPDDASWATGAAEPLPTTPEDSSWATGPAPEESASEPVRAAAPQPALDPLPSASPSAPLPITVEEPAEAPPPAVAPPAGYSPMTPQRLVDLGASGAWVQEPSAGPFHLSADGLAVTVTDEMLLRMAGLIAVVGSIEVAPENRRRRGRPTQEPFGQGGAQLQRVKGNGVIYLEPGRAKFHAVDLTDQNGASVDDDGAYLREELVFAFEEPISFENGKLSNEQLSLELAHLKGNGRILLQLDGTLRAMPIPLGAPLVVPVQRMVGWFGRVTPRLMGFGGRGAVELTGEGYALLGSPAERS